MPNVLYNIGNTPLVRINKISEAEGLKCELRKLTFSYKISFLLIFVLSFQSPSASSSTPAAASRTASG